jgi:electron transport complex protein RnfG
MLIGVSNDGKVTGLQVREMQETHGLGGEALWDWEFLAQFLNTTGNVAIGTPGQADAFSGATQESDAETDTYVDGLTGATVTSKAIARSVNSAVAFVTGADVAAEATSWGG